MIKLTPSLFPASDRSKFCQSFYQSVIDKHVNLFLDKVTIEQEPWLAQIITDVGMGIFTAVGGEDGEALKGWIMNSARKRQYQFLLDETEKRREKKDYRELIFTGFIEAYKSGIDAGVKSEELPHLHIRTYEHQYKNALFKGNYHAS